VDIEKMHYESQKGIYTAQRWMKEVGLPNLYGGKDDWWAKLPDMESPRYGEVENYILLVGTSNLTPRQEVLLYHGMFRERMDNSPVRPLVVRKYWDPIKEALGNA
jgi:hypothetical protein